jgi:hypothetical protein
VQRRVRFIRNSLTAAANAAERYNKSDLVNKHLAFVVRRHRAMLTRYGIPSNLINDDVATLEAIFSGATHDHAYAAAWMRT